MKKFEVAIIGSGPTAIYCLKHILGSADVFIKQFRRISVFEKSDKIGFGMPYNPNTTDIYNLSNISSEELPELPETFANWLRNQNKDVLKALHVTTFPIEDSQVYSRIAMGAYFHDQFNSLTQKLRDAGFIIDRFINSEVIDIQVINETILQLITSNKTYQFSKIVIATGHNWLHKDKPNAGYYATPWPIKKIIPPRNPLYHFEIGILGASLSAFDVVTSLAHRHGKFKEVGNNLTFDLNQETKGFKIILHAAEGWLPHLQYEQEEPLREIYRHTTRQQIIALRDENGFLRINDFFNIICRPALTRAFIKDTNTMMANQLLDPNFGFKEFIEVMAEKHEYIDSFEGMRKEMHKAEDSLKKNKPIHWMETLDDLMYCLNFHAEWLAAEDHLFFNKEIKPFLMNVIAALPLHSAKILLALHDANCVELIAGKVTIKEDSEEIDKTKIEISKDDGTAITKSYKLFINCSGSDTVDLENYPFKSLVESGIVRKARAKFESVHTPSDTDKLASNENVFSRKNGTFLNIGGIDVDGSYRIIGKTGTVAQNIYDLSFPHTYGCRPYSYGLQACNATSDIVVKSWLASETQTKSPVSIETVSKIYHENEEL